jgi:hypothetical protein
MSIVAGRVSGRLRRRRSRTHDPFPTAAKPTGSVHQSADIYWYLQIIIRNEMVPVAMVAKL